MPIYKQEFSFGNFEVFPDYPGDISLYQVNQTHSDIILLDPQSFTTEYAADGMLIKRKKLGDKALAIKTADCLPILYMNEEYVALIHAGWRGLAQGIHTSPLLTRNNFKEIFIGPSIRKENFEVQEDFKTHFPLEFFSEKNNHLFFSLQEFAISELEKNFSSAKITDCGICTFQNNTYNSYRRNKTDIRNWNLFLTR